MSVIQHLFRRKFSSSELDGGFRLLRTIQAGHPQCVRDGTGKWRPSSGAFNVSRSDGWMSIDLEELLHRDGLPPDFLFPALPRAVALVAHPLATYRQRGCLIEHQPIPTNYYHGGVSNISNSTRRFLARNCEYICPIDEAVAEAYAEPIQTLS